MPITPDAVLAEEQRLAEEVYDRVVAPVVRPDDDGKYVAIAFASDDFEISASDHAAITRIRARRPGERVWLMRVGRLPAYRIRGVVAGQL